MPTDRQPRSGGRTPPGRPRGRSVARLAALASASALLLGAFAAVAEADGGGVWRSAPALAPPPPVGVSPAPYPVAVGEVGQISFWAPNRGLLITGGTEGQGGPVPAGLYAYDGVDWHQLSTVCGGARGRIAWAGPDEFWTISDQRPGQVTATGQLPAELQSLSLCHFEDGRVVGSYAMPVGRPDSYLPMDAAACLGPDDCWFAGGDGGRAPEAGSFHLHWDGTELTASFDPEDQPVTGMVAFAGLLYEGLAPPPGASPTVLRTISPTGEPGLCGAETSVFCDVFPFSEGRHLPTYPKSGPASVPAAFEVATDGSPLGSGADQLWANSNGPVSVLHRDPEGTWTQVLAPGGGPSLGGLAPEPGSEGAWVSEAAESDPAAFVARLEADGTLGEREGLPAPSEPIGFRGVAGPITCPAPGECWMATRGAAGPDGQVVPSGWLFHLGDGGGLPRDADPDFAGPITYRPPDAGVPVIFPDLPPVDDSLANQKTVPEPLTHAPRVGRRRRVPVLRHVHTVLHGELLLVSFVLAGARAHVQLLGRRHGLVVARSPRLTLAPGHHRLGLRLDPDRWPTALKFKTSAVR